MAAASSTDDDPPELDRSVTSQPLGAAFGMSGGVASIPLSELVAGEVVAPSRDLLRAYSDLKRLAHASTVLTMREALEFAYSFVDQAVEIVTIAVMHDATETPLVWGAPGIGSKLLEHAGAAVQATYARVSASDAGHGSADIDRLVRKAGDEPSVFVEPLGIPLFGVLRVEFAQPVRGGDRTLLRHLAVLLSLALARCTDCQSRAPAQK